MMISDSVNAKLNEQIGHEFFAAHTYLQMSCVLESMGLTMLGKWFKKHAAEERDHGTKILKFVQQVQGKVLLSEIPQPRSEYSSATEIIQNALDEELKVTQQIHDLMTLCEQEKDYATRSFLQWFVDEQVEEVAVVREVFDLVKLAGEAHILQVEARVGRMLEGG